MTTLLIAPPSYDLSGPSTPSKFGINPLFYFLLFTPCSFYPPPFFSVCFGVDRRIKDYIAIQRDRLIGFVEIIPWVYWWDRNGGMGLANQKKFSFRWLGWVLLISLLV